MKIFTRATQFTNRCSFFLKRSIIGSVEILNQTSVKGIMLKRFSTDIAREDVRHWGEMADT